MRLPQNQHAFLEKLALTNKKLVLPQQVHGNKVSVVSKKSLDRVMGSDGLVSADDGVALGVLAADCVPLLFIDPKKRNFGVAHAGWKGTIANIALHTVEAMKTLGSDPKDIIVSVGPHIGSCCYDVAEERAVNFQHIFGDEVIINRKDRWQIDLGKANNINLVHAGILPHHIENASACTSCLSKEYYSYRKDNKETFGEIMGVVAWR